MSTEDLPSSKPTTPRDSIGPRVPRRAYGSRMSATGWFASTRACWARVVLLDDSLKPNGLEDDGEQRVQPS